MSETVGNLVLNSWCRPRFHGCFSSEHSLCKSISSSPYPLPSSPRSTNPIHKHHVPWETITTSIIPYITACQTYPWQTSWTAWTFKMKNRYLTANIICIPSQKSTGVNTLKPWNKLYHSKCLTQKCQITQSYDPAYARVVICLPL